MKPDNSAKSRQGLTVLALLLLIIALAVAGFFLVRYLQSRPAATATVVELRYDTASLTASTS
jgi:flagellar basal body-associated protein FliL